MINIYTNLHSNSRLKYVLDFIFGQVLDVEHRLLALVHYDDSMGSNSIIYSQEGIPSSGVNIYNSNWIQVSLKEQKHPWVDVASYSELSSSSDSSSSFDFSQDIFADIFYHLSRMEEYNADTDELGRFSAFSSFLYKLDALHSPIVDAHILKLKKELAQRGIDLSYRREFEFIPSYDMDYIWAFKNKGFLQALKNSGGNLLRGYSAVIKDRLRYAFLKREDPYDVWEWLREIHLDNNLKGLFFMLLSDKGPYDIAVDYQHRDYRDLVMSLNSWAYMGWHPSFASNFDNKVLEAENERYNHILKEAPIRSRQHFLKLTFPDTYNKLIAIGIVEDFSMIYADEIGFRAGTCHPFYWYDVENERQTELKIYPTAFMDVSLKNYLELKSDEALEKMINIETEVRKHSGLLISLWHNSSFYDKEGWQGWQEMYVEFLGRFK